MAAEFRIRYVLAVASWITMARWVPITVLTPVTPSKRTNVRVHPRVDVNDISKLVSWMCPRSAKVRRYLVLVIRVPPTRP
eukprot:SAG31_NODE_21066_length_558_cov_1.302832_1_plen_79_part_01